MLYDEYEAYVIQYQKDYGENTVVLYRCGSFFEIYSINDGLVPIKHLCDLLNIQVSRRSKAIVEVNRSNTLMAGFPMYALQKFTSILVSNNFTVVIVDQISEAPKPIRAVTSVVSPGTDVVNVGSDANNLMCIYGDLPHAIGIASIDLSTGRSKVKETFSTQQDPSLALDEAYRFIHSENPREVILVGNFSDAQIANLEIASNTHVHKRLQDYDRRILNIHYQNEVLNRIFPGSGLLSPIEHVDLEKKPLATTSLVYLLLFCLKHNELVLTKINKPVIVEEYRGLVLSYNCAKHLNMVGGGADSLMNLLNKCSTAIGKRLFKDWFLNPLSAKDAIEKRYDAVEFMLDNKRFVKYKAHLSEIYDIERISRRIDLNLLNPCEIVQLSTSLDAVQAMLSLDCLNCLNCVSVMDFAVDAVQVSEMIDNLKTTIDMYEVQKYNLDNISKSFFCTGVFPDVDELQEKVEKNVGFFDLLVSALNDKVGSAIFKVEFNQIDGYHLVVTSKRFNDTKEVLRDFRFEDFVYAEVISKNTSAKASTIKLTHNCFRGIGDQTKALQADLADLIKVRFSEYIQSFLHLYRDDIKKLVTFIGQIDFFVSAAEVAFHHRYFRPEIAGDAESSKSFMQCEDLRHPIIERINQSVEYVSNSANIGLPDSKGILLYGTNMVGKSAYMKSIGLAIIMAQCGMYVPCRNMKYCPYKQIFTRMPSGDDLYKGQSTFAVEIGELRNILKRADENSLVIGDELASGTESISAISIVASGIMQLSAKKTSFVFATHLHDLTKLTKIRELVDSESLRIYHLSVTYDESRDVLVFNRKLQPGQGNTIYGLEVCRALNIGKEFMEIANDFRRELLGQGKEIVKSSKYNKAHFVDKCSICGDAAEEVHHIKEQSTADQHGFIGTVHKNVKHNLVNVCSVCHDKIHHDGGLVVEGYVQTSAGVELKIRGKGVDVEGVRGDVNEQRVLELRKQGLSCAKIQQSMPHLTLYRIQKLIKEFNTI